MLQFSYWLFPLLFAVFVTWPSSRAFLLPGLVAACVAGAANSVVVHNDAAAVGHALSAALIVCVASFNCAQPLLRSSSAQTLGALLAWTTAACVICGLVSDESWPYALSQSQMLLLFISFLVPGAAICLLPAFTLSARSL